MFLFHNWAANRTPGRNTATQRQYQYETIHLHVKVCAYMYVGVRVHLYVPAVVTSGWQLDSSECDRTFERNFDRRLLNAVLSVQTGGPGDGAATEVSLYWHKKTIKRTQKFKNIILLLRTTQSSFFIQTSWVFTVEPKGFLFLNE